MNFHIAQEKKKPANCRLMKVLNVIILWDFKVTYDVAKTFINL